MDLKRKCQSPAETSQHQQLEIEQGQGTIINNDIEVTAGQRENPGNPMNRDVIATQDTSNLSGDVSRGVVGDAISEIDDVDNLELTEPCNLHDNEKENESSITRRSPYALRSRKK